MRKQAMDYKKMFAKDTPGKGQLCKIHTKKKKTKLKKFNSQKQITQEKKVSQRLQQIPHQRS